MLAADVVYPASDGAIGPLLATLSGAGGLALVAYVEREAATTARLHAALCGLRALPPRPHGAAPRVDLRARPLGRRGAGGRLRGGAARAVRLGGGARRRHLSGSRTNFHSYRLRMRRAFAYRTPSRVAASRWSIAA